MIKYLKIKLFLTLVLTAIFMSIPAQATVVEVRTVSGDFQINLFDDITPATVQNFLDYVNSGAYANNVVHRLEPGFVAQAGGFTYNNTTPLDAVPTGPNVTNEPELSNVRGTIAMAKLSNQPDSATSQWFINLNNNSANLDVQNGGFTVFGQVLGDGMQILDSIADLNRFNLGGATNSIPLRNYTETDAVNQVPITDEHLVIISDIVIIDATPVTNPDLNPTLNTLINTPTQPTPGVPDEGSSGGAFGGKQSIALVCLLCGLLISRRHKAALTVS